VLAFPGSTGEAGAGTCVVVGGSGTTVEAGGTGAVVKVIGAGGSTVCFGAEGELVDTGCAVGKSVVVGNGSTDVEVVPGAGPDVSSCTGVNADGGSKRLRRKLQVDQAGSIRVFTLVGHTMLGFKVYVGSKYEPGWVSVRIVQPY